MHGCMLTIKKKKTLPIVWVQLKKKQNTYTHHIHIFEVNKFELFLTRQTNGIENQNFSIELKFLLNISYFVLN